MFTGFKIDLDDSAILGDYFFATGKEIIESHRKEIKDNIGLYIGRDSCLDGTEIQDDWFPEIDADIFLSHSHKDEKLVISLAGWLYELFGLRAFVDSCIWGYSNDLLRLIDNEYCYSEETDTYNYSKRNYSTSHVHMMLCMALTKMIDKAECLFFINTPNSLVVSENIRSHSTASPWIYAELQISEVIRRKSPSRVLKHFNKDGVPLMENTSQLRIKYDVNLKHLIELNNQDLAWWWKAKNRLSRETALDALYAYKNIIGHN